MGKGTGNGGEGKEILEKVSNFSVTSASRAGERKWKSQNLGEGAKRERLKDTRPPPPTPFTEAPHAATATTAIAVTKRITRRAAGGTSTAPRYTSLVACRSPR